VGFGGLPGVGGTFRAVDLFATATNAAARCCQRSSGLWIVGLLHAPSLTFFAFGETKWVCEGLLARARLGVGSTNGPTLMTFASPSETQSGLRCPLARSAEPGRPDDLPWLASLDLGSSHGVVIDPPLHRHLYLVSTPSGSAAPKSCRGARLRGDARCGAEPPSARSCHLPDSFRPCRSSRLRRFAPPSTSQVCCTLKPIMGFARLQVSGARSGPPSALGSWQATSRRPAVPSSPRGTRSGIVAPVAAHTSEDVLAGSHRDLVGGRQSSDHSHWRSTLRSFSLAFSRPASTASPSRAPAFPAASANRVVGGGRCVDRSGSAGHRGPCLLAVGPG